jgi:8-oxo-dGTP pyrophosphatase MutT (NUDIX family)|tara:strand:- start:43355 stop:43933 length:579 start_codon:yes stop_codon:yes gene_type:complete
MHAKLEKIIATFTPQSDKEKLSQDALLRLLPALPRCLYRDHFVPGHITGSGFLVSADGQRILLNHHKFLDKWLHFGGHADGDDDILNVARREVEEESGLSDFVLAYEGVLSIDVHDIPENTEKGEPAHKHFDVIFLFRLNHGSNETPQISDESIKLKWAPWNGLAQFSLEPHLQSALDKAHKILKETQADAA